MLSQAMNKIIRYDDSMMFLHIIISETDKDNDNNIFFSIIIFFLSKSISLIIISCLNLLFEGVSTPLTLMDAKKYVSNFVPSRQVWPLQYRSSAMRVGWLRKKIENQTGRSQQSCYITSTTIVSSIINQQHF